MLFDTVTYNILWYIYNNNGSENNVATRFTC